MKTFLFNLLFTTLSLFAAKLFFDSFCAKKHYHFTSLVACGIGAITTTAALTFPVHIASSLVRLFIGIALFVFFHWCIYEGSAMYRIFLSIMFYAILCTIENFVFTGFLSFQDWRYADLLSHSLFPFLLGLLVRFIAFFICFALNKLRTAQNTQPAAWTWYSLPTVLSFLCILMVFCLNHSYAQGGIEPFPLFLCGAFLVAINIAAVALVSWMEQSSYLREESLSLRSQIKAQSEGIEALSASNTAQRKMTHDFRAHLETLGSLLDQQEIEYAKEYIHKLHDGQTERIFLVNTHHAAMDAILNQKANTAKKHGIDIQFVVNDLSPLKIDSVDMTVIISNLMDNAIEACNKLPQEERRIYVKVLLDDALFFSVRNTSPFVQVYNNAVITTKNNSLLHGYGLQNVRTILKKYDSFFGLDYKDGWFSAYLEVPNTPVS